MVIYLFLAIELLNVIYSVLYALTIVVFVYI